MAKPLVLPLAQDQPGSPLNIRFQLVFHTTGSLVRCPGMWIQPGMVVTLRTVNGSVINQNACSIAEYPEALFGSGAAFAVPPGSDVTVPWPVTNTSEIWATGSEGDGLLVVIQKAQVG